MGKLIILRGNSGSGKTTIAKELQWKFGRNTMLISQDVIRRDMLRKQELTELFERGMLLDRRARRRGCILECTCT